MWLLPLRCWDGVRSTLVLLLLLVSVLGCGASARGGTAPLAPPGPGASGCVESAELRQFVQALEASRVEARAQALARLGVVDRPRPSRFLEPTPAPGAGVKASEGRRLEVVALLATSTPPLVPLAQAGQRLQPIDERPRRHPIPVRACGVNACPSPAKPVLPPVRALAVELLPGEQLGPPLQLSYDYWWAQVSYDRARACPPSAELAPPAGGAGTP